MSSSENLALWKLSNKNIKKNTEEQSSLLYAYSWLEYKEKCLKYLHYRVIDVTTHIYYVPIYVENAF
jgi:hypothetical protein